MNPENLLWAEIHQVTRALAEHPEGFAKWCEGIRQRLLETGAVAVKLVEPGASDKPANDTWKDQDAYGNPVE